MSETKQIKEKFNEKYEPVTESGCWIWTASINNCGYGKISVDGKIKGAHRVSYELHVGEIPKGMCVLHKCDVPACVNPDHLFLGTHQDNMRDKTVKGRHVSTKGQTYNRGSVHGEAKLNEVDVRLIKQLLKTSNLMQKQIGKYFGVDHTTISEINTGRNWSYVKVGNASNRVINELISRISAGDE